MSGRLGGHRVHGHGLSLLPAQRHEVAGRPRVLQGQGRQPGHGRDRATDAVSQSRAQGLELYQSFRILVCGRKIFRHLRGCILANTSGGLEQRISTVLEHGSGWILVVNLL